MLAHEYSILNKFRILKERHIRMRKPYRLPGWTKNSSYIVLRSGIELTTSRLYSFIVANVSHALNHSVKRGSQGHGRVTGRGGGMLGT